MTAATLKEVLDPAMRGGYAVAGLVVLGWEDAVAFVQAAEEADAPVILQAGPGCRKHTPVRVLGAMFRQLADQARVPVVSHIDHAYSLDECREGIDFGFTSVMFDGSKLPIIENIRHTAEIVDLARAAGVSVEGEVGIVGYAGGARSTGTDPGEAERFVRETGVDALAISVGNIHLQQEQGADIDLASVRAIEAVTGCPLVLHGGSGIPVATRRMLARQTRVSKFNIGTELRKAFGAGLRATLASDPDLFDRIEILKAVIPRMQAEALAAITNLEAASTR
ncbi:MAG: class II fructose-bisphosphate aldolase [Inquilinaceae bacterium]